MNTKPNNKNEGNVTVAAEVPKSEVALREEEILAFWRANNVFEKSVETPAGSAPAGDFVFYDGPPFATGLPHYGHILAGTIKDAIPRFHTMNGKRVVRKWGWDCHGLPLENIIEKRLGLATKRDIEEMGIKQFNEAARDAVLEYADDWRRIIPRMGRFVDMEDDYKTMDSTYTESVWWVFSELNRKGLVYEGFKSMHLCPRCGTTLSNFEVNQAYKDIKDIAVTVKLPLLDENGMVTDTSLLVWTTTPWTLPGNMAAAVHNEHDYVKVRVTLEKKEETVILAKARLAQLGTDEYEILEEMKGADLVGKSYEPPFDFWKDQEFKNKENAWKVWHADYVELGEEGTGAVHLAPAYGEEDMDLAREYGIPVVHHVGEDGRFKDFVADFAGQLVKPKDADEVSHLDADIEIVKALKAKDRLLKKENITHSYPHCWRCDTPLLNYATTSWFVKVTDIKDELVAENNKIKWVPEHVGRARFGKWLEGARDWAVSRQRYWGAPLPIWKNPETGAYKIFGSLEELKAHVPKSGNTYFMMRHGESESNVREEISCNKENSDGLTAKGREQVAAALSSIPSDIDLIIHSGFQRTRESAEIVHQHVPSAELIEDDRIRELDLSDDFEGKTWDLYNALFANWTERYTKKLEGSENRRDVQIRMGAFLYDLDTKYVNKKILIVSHAGPLFALRCAAQGLNPEEAEQFHHDGGGYPGNAVVEELPFVKIPHNDNFELDFHRPYIDEVEVVDENGIKLERIPDVFDCWFESGSMPYGEQHYPFEHTDRFDPKTGKGYPANFISEGLDQTRGWFYSLIVLGTALFGKSPYQNVIVSGLVLAEDGKKMSKSLQNYPDPMELADQIGVDAIRFYMLSSPIMRAEDLNFSEKEALELQRKNIGRLHNVLQMYELYAGEGATFVSDSSNVLDRWIVARLRALVAEVTTGFTNYELDRATRPITDFIDDLSVWYVRRSRDRFKSEDVEDKARALGTLRYVLETLARVMAPSMPFYSEYLYGRVKEAGAPESVHLTAWPVVDAPDIEVLEEMTAVRALVSEALELRAKANIKIRQPLQTLSTTHVFTGDTEGYKMIVRDEVNVKEVLSEEKLSDPVVLDTTITDELRREGAVREFIRNVQESRKKLGLSPHDRIVLSVNEAARALLEGYEQVVQNIVGADTITEDRTADPQYSATVDGSVYSYSIVRP